MSKLQTVALYDWVVSFEDDLSREVRFKHRDEAPYGVPGELVRAVVTAAKAAWPDAPTYEDGVKHGREFCHDSVLSFLRERILQQFMAHNTECAVALREAYEAIIATDVGVKEE